LLLEIKNSKNKIETNLKPITYEKYIEKKFEISEDKFRYGMNSSPFAVEKLSEGIRSFINDTEKLETIIKEKIQKLFI